MADNIFIQDPVYLTIAQVKASTSKPAIAGLTDDEIKVLIYKAQRAVDEYINPIPKYTAYGDTWLFPITVNSSPVIPDDIKIATLYMVEQIYINGDTITGDTRMVKSEKTWPHDVTYENSGITYIPPEVSRILDKYKATSFATIL